jgi:hypothetical protein
VKNLSPSISPINLALTIIIIAALFGLSFWSIISLREKIGQMYLEARAEAVAQGMTPAQFDAASSDISKGFMNWLMKSVSDNIIFLLGVPILGFIIGSAVSMAGVFILPKIASAFVYLATSLVVIMGLASVGLGIMSGNILLLGSGGLLVLYTSYKLLFGRKSLRKASYILSASATVVKEEKEVLLPPLIFFVISIFVNLALIAFIAVDPTLNGQSIFNFQYGAEVKELLVLALGTFTHTFFYFSLMSIVVGITFVWYRKKDPDLKLGISIALSRLDTIFGFSIIKTLIMVIDRALDMMSRKKEGQKREGVVAIIAIFASIIRGIIGTIWSLVNYFTLQTITIDGLGAKDSIKRSAKVLKDSIPDVLTKEVIANSAMNFMGLILFFMLSSGCILTSYLLNLGALQSIVMFVLLLVFGYIPITITMQTLAVNYNTILYSYSRDRIFGINKPARIPDFMKEELDQARSKIGAEKRYQGITGKLLKFFETNEKIENALRTKDSGKSLDEFIA